MLITDLKQQVKDGKRVSVFLDGKFAFGMTDVDVLFYHLRIGEELTEERYSYILEQCIYE